MKAREIGNAPSAIFGVRLTKATRLGWASSAREFTEVEETDGPRSNCTLTTHQDAKVTALYPPLDPGIPGYVDIVFLVLWWDIATRTPKTTLLWMLIGQNRPLSSISLISL